MLFVCLASAALKVLNVLSFVRDALWDQGHSRTSPTSSRGTKALHVMAKFACAIQYSFLNRINCRSSTVKAPMPYLVRATQVLCDAPQQRIRELLEVGPVQWNMLSDERIKVL